ncbi:MAG: hypothetical protein HKN09_11635, partial [Saprospiraceae bacterium]|nr:hypothetical protein [Saprospiraceae bacterium]
MIGQHFNPEPINKLILILLLSLFTTQSDIYIPEHFTGCGYSYLAEHQNYDHTMRLLDKQAAQFVSSKKALYTLPVVCHIIHNNGSENISDDEVIAAIEDLNEAFENIGYYDPTTGVNADIEFCLALRTPDENASNGIIRTESTLTDFAYDIDDINLKNLSRWDPNHHINIWIVKEIRTTHSGSGVAGYATLPASHGRAIDGIVVESRFLNQSKSETTVLVHEMGHYLGLYHTFQGGCINSDCSTSGDHVCDTPPDNSTSRVPCDAPANSCNSDVNSGFSSDQNDMINNYMDYSALECYNAFTEGQRNRMHYFIENIRQSLLDSKACQSPCLNPIGIGPVQSSFETVTGAAFQINPDITGANDYSWMIDGTLHSTNNIFEHVFNAPGDYLIELIVENGDPNCDQILSFEVDVDCDIEFEIISDATYLEVGDVANFSHQTQNEDDIYWYINDQPYSIANAISYSFINEGYYEICLEASNTYCSETKCVAIIVSDNAPQCNDSKLVQYETNGPWINAMESIGDQVIGGGSIEGCSALLFFDESLNIEESFTLSDCNGWLVNYLTYDELDHIYIGCNNVDNESILIIKYQLSSRTIIWQRSIHHTERINYRARILLYGNSVFLQGQMDGVIHGCDALLIELNAEDGMMLNDIVYHLGSCETFSASIISNNSIISAGRFNNAGGGQSKFRFAVATMNLNADIQWCNLYTVGLEGNARTYATHILDTGNSLVLAGFGDYHGTGVNDIDLIFQEIDYDGDIVRHHSYTTNQGNTYRPRAFTILPNGYLLFGDFIDASGIDRSFILSISKLGVPLSFRAIERSVATHLSTAEIVGGQI